MHLSSLLDRVANGEEITITRHGVPTALLIPVEAKRHRLSHLRIVEGMRELRKRVQLSDMSIRGMINEGRRY